MKKKLFAILICCLLLLSLLTGCAAEAKDVSLGELVRTEEGFAYAEVPFGSKPESFSVPLSPLGSAMETPFPYQRYLADEVSTVLDRTCRVSADFADDGACFSISFQFDATAENADKEYKALLDDLTKAFGEPVENTDDGMGNKYAEWQDKKSGTALALNCHNVGTPTLMITICEKSRYVDAGIGTWKE